MDADLRDQIAVVARSELATYGKNPRKSEYWRVSGMPADTNADWCGAFVLWALRTAGTIVPSDWIPGDGFIGPSHLHVTSDPQPGDILYKDQPWQHESIVVARNGNTVTTIDGNSPLISEHQHDLGTPGIVYYSVASLGGSANAPFWTPAKAGAAALLATLIAGWAARRKRKRS